MAESTQKGGLQRVENGLAAGSAAQDGNPVTVLMARARTIFGGMTSAQRTRWGSMALFGLAIAAGMLWYAGRPDWKPLFNGLDTKDVQQVTQTLSAAGLQYQLTPDGSGVEVPASTMDKARMEIAAKGMPQTGRMGFELFDKPNWVGSEFDEKVNYQRALEGELEHTIDTLSAVRSARVHLSLPEKSLFSSQESAAKASVVLKLRRSSLSQDQIDQIRALVAGAVDTLTPDQVTLVDADGRVSFKPRTNDMVAMDAEQAMEGRLVAMLEPLAGHDNVRATVNITRDDSTQDRLDEVYDPTQSVTLSSQRTDQIAPGRATAAAGVPGTASNTSAASAPGTVQGAVQSAAAGTTPAANAPALPIYPQGAGGGQSAHEENSQFAVTKHTIHREDVPGRISRITAAVVVNDRASTVGTGDAMHTVWKPRSADEMKRLTELAQAAVGYETTRGDQVVLENIGFQSNQPEPQVKGLAKATEQAQTLLHTQPMLVKDIGLALVGSLLVFFVLRPIVEHTGAALRASASPSAPLALASPIANVAITESPVIADQEELKLKAPKQRMMMNFVTEHIRKEPAQTAQLLQSWIASEEES